MSQLKYKYKLFNILRSKEGGLLLKLGQLMEYYVREISMEKNMWKMCLRH